MRTIVLGGAIACLLAAVWLSQSPATPAQNLPPRGGSLLALPCLTNGHQQIAVIDQDTRVMSVYHVNPTNGEISLRSVRAIGWDLEMEEFNTPEPSPREIRALLGRK